MILHSNMVHTLKKSGADILAGLTAEEVSLMHMLLGLAGEVGELVDAVKKVIVYGLPLDMPNVIEELGDIEFYLEGLRQDLSLNRNDILAANVTKLRVRYGSGYSDEKARERKDKK